MVNVQKPNDKLRICLGPSDLNKATKYHHHHLPITEEMYLSCPMGKFLLN